MGKYLLLFSLLLIQSEIFSQRAESAALNPNPVDPNKNWPVYSPTDSTYLLSAEEMPEPIGGIEGIQSKVTYTEDAKLNGIEGKLYVLAKINENGDVVETEIIRSLGHGLDESAIDAISKTKFTPGKNNGIPVRVQVSIPIIFSLR